MYQWNFNIKLQFTNFSLFISDADFQSKSNNWIPWSRSTILYLILILILIFILGETRARDRESVWSLDQHQQQQQQQPRICMDIASFYGIVSYAVGVSLILSVAGIKSGRRFFHLFNNRHAARHADQIVENGHGERVNHRRRPPSRDQDPLDLMMGGMESVNRDRVFTDNPEVSGQESGRGSITSRFWVSSHALEGQKWKWFDQISCQWERVPKESVCNDLFR